MKCLRPISLSASGHCELFFPVLPACLLLLGRGGENQIPPNKEAPRWGCVLQLVLITILPVKVLSLHGKGKSQAWWGRRMFSQWFLLPMGLGLSDVRETPVLCLKGWSYLGCFLVLGQQSGNTGSGLHSTCSVEGSKTRLLCCSSSPGVPNQLTFFL